MYDSSLNSTSSQSAYPLPHQYIAGFYIPDPLSPIQLLQRSVSLIGVSGNLIAMFVVVRGRSIRSHASYVLLFNQSLADGMCCFYSLILPLLDHFKRPYISGGGLSTSCHYLFCVFVNSSSFLVIVNIVSTMNLLCMAVERMLAVVYPLLHRRHADDKAQRLAAGLIWPAVFCFAVPFVVVNNGVRRIGVCYYNDRMREHRWFVVTFETCGYYLPLAGMTACYVSVLRRLVTGGAVVKRRLVNVLRTLVTVVVVYVLCSCPRNVITIMSAFDVTLGRHRANLFTTAYTLKIASFCVNPLIYTLQYSDYRNELKRMLGFKSSRVDSQINTTSRPPDSKLVMPCAECDLDTTL